MQHMGASQWSAPQSGTGSHAICYSSALYASIYQHKLCSTSTVALFNHVRLVFTRGAIQVMPLCNAFMWHSFIGVGGDFTYGRARKKLARTFLHTHIAKCVRKIFWWVNAIHLSQRGSLLSRSTLAYLRWVNRLHLSQRGDNERL